MDHHKGDEFFDRRAYMVMRYRIPPSLHDKFMDAWYKMEKDVAKEDNVKRYNLMKTMQDNVEFVTYGEWHCMADYMEHYHAKHTRDFLDFMAKNDLTWEIFPLKNVTDTKHEMRDKKTVADQDDPNNRQPAHIMFHFHAHPSVKNKFIDAWEDMAKGTWDEKSNIVYSLRKVTTNNHHFWGIGVWESMSDFLDHKDSKHVNEFHKFAEKHDVLWYFEPVYPLGKEFKLEF
jgi:quinol monooxygenase YgiN